MQATALNAVRRIVPQFAQDLAYRAVSTVYGFHGDFSTFDEALAKCGEGYSADSIAVEVREAARRHVAARTDEGMLELNVAASRQFAAVGRTLARMGREPVRVLDLGGSWGRHYFDCKRFFGAGFVAGWDVLETTAVVKAIGETLAAERELRFYESTESLDLSRYSLVFASGALQCVPDPSETFARFCDAKIRFIMLDRVPLIEASRHRLTVQTVPPWIYSAKYPAWFLSRAQLSNIWEARGYHVSVNWMAPEDAPFLDGSRLPYQGLVLERE